MTNQPTKDILTPAQWKVLLAVADTIIAELTEDETSNVLVDSRSNAVTKNADACKEFAKFKFSSDSRKPIDFKICLATSDCI